jgi:hypothetical protein
MGERADTFLWQKPGTLARIREGLRQLRAVDPEHFMMKQGDAAQNKVESAIQQGKALRHGVFDEKSDGLTAVYVPADLVGVIEEALDLVTARTSPSNDGVA